MSSILTNNSAMVALQTLKNINMNLGKVQSEISTGKTIESAKDNAATWAISKVMSSDVAGFEAISDSLALGQGTVGVALNAAEGITDLLTEIKGKIVNSQEENVDRAKIQTDIVELRNQIASISGAAQFNGLNLVKTSPVTSGATNTIAQQIANTEVNDVNILSSLDRSATGVASSTIDLSKQSLDTSAQTAGTVAASATTIDTADALTALAATVAAGASANFGINGDVSADAIARQGNRVLAGDTYTFEASGFGKMSAAIGAAITADVVYVAKAGDTTGDIAAGLALRLNMALTKAGFEEDFAFTSTQNADGTAELTITNNSGAVTTAFAAGDLTVSSGGTAGGGLDLLADLDVSTDTGAKAALVAIESLIQKSIDSAAALGSAGKRIETQNTFVGKLIDGLTSGIGALVDADMEAASARLQALQTQQQLGVQALSIANQAPQTILSLFR